MTDDATITKVDLALIAHMCEHELTPDDAAYLSVYLRVVPSVYNVVFWMHCIELERGFPCMKRNSRLISNIAARTLVLDGNAPLFGDHRMVTRINEAVVGYMCEHHLTLKQAMNLGSYMSKLPPTVCMELWSWFASTHSDYAAMDRNIQFIHPHVVSPVLAASKVLLNKK
jgi:hypothetical protein